MTLFEGICIGFALGVVVTLISILGVMYALDKAEHDNDRDVGCDLCECDRDHSCMGGLMEGDKK